MRLREDIGAAMFEAGAWVCLIGVIVGLVCALLWALDHLTTPQFAGLLTGLGIVAFGLGFLALGVRR